MNSLNRQIYKNKKPIEMKNSVSLIITQREQSDRRQNITLEDKVEELDNSVTENN